MPPRREIGYTNPRRIATINIPGSVPQYQDMGEEETSISWEGVLDGSGAYQEALALDELKNAGKEISFLAIDFPDLPARVRLRRFDYRLIRQDRIEYSIELVSIKDPPRVVGPSSSATSGTSGQTSNGSTTALSSSTRKTHKVVPGDTLSAIAIKYYGSHTRWREIASANKITDPRKLKVGQKLVIP